MNRRRFTCLGVAASIAALHPVAYTIAARQTSGSFAEYLTVDLSLVQEAHVRTFQLPANSSWADQLSNLYWTVAIGCLVSAPDDIAAVRDAAWPAVPEWYIASDPGITLGQSFEAGIGGQSIGDGASGRYWDVDNPDDPEDFWRQFAIGCVAVWSDQRLLMLWGCAAEGNPVAPLLDLASATTAAWDMTATSLVPEIARLPVGMGVIDDGPLLLDTTPSRPNHGGGR